MSSPQPAAPSSKTDYLRRARKLCPYAALVSLAACSTPVSNQRERFVPARPVTTIVSDTVTGTVEGAWAAAQMPFEDFNLTRQDIPEPLQKIAENPYALPPQLLCDDLHKQISELNTLLGPDICVPQNIPLTPAHQRLWLPHGRSGRNLA